jgi:hypothetical protein
MALSNVESTDVDPFEIRILGTGLSPFALTNAKDSITLEQDV